MTGERSFDVISLGRATLDLYAQQLGARLEDATSFAKHLGGASAAIAFGCARLGLRVAMISRVGDDAAGRFVVETLAAEGCDVSHVAVDRERRTALMMLGIRDRDSLPQGLYRDNCADLAVDDSAADEAFIARGRALVVTGTQFSTASADRVSSLAVERARRHGVRTVLDIDYGPELWGLRGAGNEHVASRGATAHLQSLVGRFDLVVGTRDEIQLAGGSDDLVQALRVLRGLTTATVVVKLGAAGCAIIDGEVPSRIDGTRILPGFAVDAVNGFGAGDGFLAGLLHGWLGGMAWRDAARQANACGALVCARHAAAAAMPTAAELAHFLAATASASPRPVRPDADPVIARLHRVTPRRRAWGDLCLISIDDRAQAFEQAREAGVPEARLGVLKQLCVRAAAEAEQAMALHGRLGALIDDTYGEDALRAATGRGWWLSRPVEVSGSSPLELEGGRSIGSQLIAWPRDHVVKCLVRFHPDEPVEDRLEQETQLTALYRAVIASGHELLLELIVPSRPVSLPNEGDTVARAVKRLYNIGIHPDWWGLEPVPAETWRALDALIGERDPFCRGVLLLDRGGDPGALTAAAASRSCCGFFVGRTSLRAPGAAWLAGAIDDDALVAQVRAACEQRAAAWQRARATRRAASEPT
jgi:5-dehydro-2-deoxygluconokinase